MFIVSLWTIFFQSIRIPNVRDEVRKPHRCLVEIKIKAELEDGHRPTHNCGVLTGLNVQMLQLKTASSFHTACPGRPFEMKSEFFLIKKKQFNCSSANANTKAFTVSTFSLLLGSTAIP